MTCQLARCLKANKYPDRVGWLVWVCMHSPYVKSVLLYGTEERLPPKLYFDTPYFDSFTGRPMVVNSRCFELLPYFRECDAMSFEAMEARCGERLPEQENI